MPKVATRVEAGAVMHALAEPAPSDLVETRILDAAGRLLLGDGLAGVEVDRVAAGAGVGRSTVYRRFDDRNALLAATVAHEARRLLDSLAAAVDPADPLLDQVTAAFTAGLAVARATGLATVLREEPLLLRLLTVDAAPVLEAARTHLTALALRRDLGIPAATVARTADVLVRLAVSYVVTPDDTLDERSVRAMLALVVGT